MKFFVRLHFVFGGLSEKLRNKVEFTTLKNLRCKENLHYIYEYEKNSICFCLQKRHLPTKSVFEAHLRDLVYTQFCSSVLIETVKKTMIFSNCQKKQEFLTESNWVVKKLHCIKRTKQRLSTPTKNVIYIQKTVFEMYLQILVYKKFVLVFGELYFQVQRQTPKSLKLPKADRFVQLFSY